MKNNCLKILYCCLLINLPIHSALAYQWNTQYQIPKPVPANEVEKEYLARISVHSPEELAEVLHRADLFFESRNNNIKSPITIVLHGTEAEVFVSENYKKYKMIVKLAAQLQALQVVDLLICETWMGVNGYRKGDLYDFVGTVPYGPGEIKRLRKLGHVYF